MFGEYVRKNNVQKVFGDVFECSKTYIGPTKEITNILVK